MYFQDKGMQINQMYMLLPDLIVCSNCHQIKNSWHLLYNSAQVTLFESSIAQRFGNGYEFEQILMPSMSKINIYFFKHHL